MPGNRLVIGLDYGTTFTGVAFCEATSDNTPIDNIQVVHDWPGHHGQLGTKEKVPSEISYSASPSGKVLWGSLIPPQAQRQVWTKLELDEQKRGDELKMLLELLTGIGNLDLTRFADRGGPPAYPGKDPVDIVADYLSHVKGQLIKNLEKTYEGVYLSMPIDLVITVPAVWSDRAKDRTFRAVAKAGFDEKSFPNLRETIMVTEPEAAAIYVLKTMKGGKQGEDVAIGDCFVLCDAGGGTVDLISYRVKTIHPTFQIEEAAIGTGEKCGGSFVDRNFTKWLEKKIGTADYKKIADNPAGERDQHMLEPKMGRLMQAFLTAKTSFGSEEDEEHILPLPSPLNAIDDPSRGIDCGEIRVTSDDLKEMFDPCVEKTCNLIAGQIDQVQRAGSQVKYVFLVGGFGKSPYMFDRVRQFARTRGISTIQPTMAWSAVVRGAVARGLESGGSDLIYLRKCRRHYGTPASEPFSAFKHTEEDAYIDEHDGEKYAKGQMSWLIKKGDPLLSSQARHAEIELYRTFDATDSRVFKARLVACDADVAPRRYADDSAYNVTILSADLSSVPESKFQVARSGPQGKPYFIANFKINISLTSNLKFWLTFNGQEYGSVTTQYD